LASSLSPRATRGGVGGGASKDMRRSPRTRPDGWTAGTVGRREPIVTLPQTRCSANLLAKARGHPEDRGRAAGAKLSFGGEHGIIRAAGQKVAASLRESAGTRPARALQAVRSGRS